jgi:hypothetical protein
MAPLSSFAKADLLVVAQQSLVPHSALEPAGCDSGAVAEGLQSLAELDR